MPRHDTAALDSGHLLSPEMGRPPMAKADLRKAETADWRAQLGAAVKRVKGPLSLKEFATLIDRDERQVGRWIEGKERPQFDAILAVPMFRGPLVIALAQLTGDVDVCTTITVRRA